MTHPTPDVDDELSPAELTQAEKLEEMFGGRRGVVDGAVPPIVFVVTNSIRHSVREAAIAAVGSAVLLLLIRLFRRERTRHVFSGVLGVAISAGIAARSGRASNYFIPGIVLNAGYLAVFVLSVVFRKPIVGLVLKQFSDKPAAWHDHPTVRRVYSELTLMWALMYGLRVAVLEPLRRQDATGLAAVMKIALGYPPLLLMLAITVPYLHRRTAGVQVEDGTEQPDGDGDVSDPPDPSRLPPIPAG